MSRDNPKRELTDRVTVFEAVKLFFLVGVGSLSLAAVVVAVIKYLGV